MAVEDVVRAIMQVRPHLLEFRRPRSLRYPNFDAPANFSEASTRYTVIDPVLRSLGWDLSDPYCCCVEYQTKEPVRDDQGDIVEPGRRVDYALIGPGGYPVVLVEAKRLELSFRPSSFTAGVSYREWYRELYRAKNRKKWWEDGKSGTSSLPVYLKDVGTASAGMLTNGQEWLFIEWMGDGNWKWDRWAIKLSGSSVDRSAGLLYDRLAPEFYSQSS